MLATLDVLRQQTDELRSINVRSIVERILPSVGKLLDSEIRDDPDALCEAAVRANIHAAVDQLRHGSGVLEQLIDDNELRIVGAEYSLESCAVEFL